MDKLLKHLMLLLVTTLSLTLSACGGDDEDEPTPPDSSFLYGTWHYQRSTHGSIDMTFSSDGSFNADYLYYGDSTYKIIGKWEYKKGKISITGKAYHQDDRYLCDYNSTLGISYDEYINKLIVNEEIDSETSISFLSGQYTKM